MLPSKLSILFLLVPFFLMSCSSFRLAEYPGHLSVMKQRRAKDVICAVKPFTYHPIEADEKDLMTEEDLRQWQFILADGLNKSNIFADVVAQHGEKAAENTVYLIDGKIKRFYFKKNWVPTFFPFHLGLSFITLTAYTWLSGPTTVTKVNFKVEVNLKDAKSGALLKRFMERYDDTSTLNVYSNDVYSPYGNPGLVFSNIIDALTTEIADALS